MARINNGDFWIVNLTIKTHEKSPVGHEQGFMRPCLVLVHNKFAQLSTVIPVTGNSDALRFPHTYLIKKTKKNGLKSDSVAMIFHLRSLSEKRFLNKLGTIDKKDLDLIRNVILNYLNL